MKLKVVNLSDKESEVAIQVIHESKYIMNKVPLFILSPFTLHKQNKERVGIIIKRMITDEKFVKNSGIAKDRLEMIILGASGFALWRRGWVMRIQWCLQIIAAILMVKILWVL
jgi:hypothetical protein